MSVSEGDPKRRCGNQVAKKQNEDVKKWESYTFELSIIVKLLRILTWITANIRDTVQHVHLFNDLPKLSRQGVFKDNKFWRHAACLVRKCHGNHVRPSYPMTFPADGVWRCWTAWCDAATFEKSSSGTTPNAREQLLLRSCGVLLLISKYL